MYQPQRKQTDFPQLEPAPGKETPAASNVLTRRNGTPQSCEPCRKRKLRCDHARPICGRCAAKNIASKCFYHPSPMTKRKEWGSPSGDVFHISSSMLPSESPISQSNPSSASHESSSSQVGYLGTTSYTAVMDEYENEEPLPQQERPLASSTANIARSIRPEHVGKGVRVLRFLYDFPECDILVRKYQARSLVTVMPDALIESIMSSTRVMFNSMHNPPGLDVHLRDFAVTILQNCSRPLTVSRHMTFEQYSARFTGFNTRWEALGNIFSIAGMALVATPDHDPLGILMSVRAKNISKDELVAEILDVIDDCLALCNQASCANELLALFQHNDEKLRTHVEGDSSYESWRRLANVMTTIYAGGLHQDSSPKDYPPFLIQWRRLFFSACFRSDKSMATFVGRPPMIDSRYCSLEPPLDITDEVLLSSNDVYQEAVASLGSAGWNHQSRTRFGVARLRFLLSISREQALEIAMGGSRTDLIQRSNEILNAARATWESSPDHLRFDRCGETSMPAHQSPSFIVPIMYMDYLYTIFLVQRTIVKHINTGHNELFTTSRHLLTTVMRIYAPHEDILDVNRQKSWLMLYYGLPSASVLAYELLRQSTPGHPSRSRRPSSNALSPQQQRGHEKSLEIPRAEVIRNLSTFISCLSWVVNPSDGNYHLCKEAEKKLSQVLNAILNSGGRPEIRQDHRQQYDQTVGEAATATPPSASFNTDSIEETNNTLSNFTIQPDQQFIPDFDMDLDLHLDVSEMNLDTFIDWSGYGNLVSNTPWEFLPH